LTHFFAGLLPAFFAFNGYCCLFFLGGENCRAIGGPTGINRKMANSSGEVVMVRKSWKQMRENIKYEIYGLLVVALGIFCLVSLFSDAVGLIGNFCYRILHALAGQGAYAIPICLVYYGINIMRQRKGIFFDNRTIGLLLLLLIIATFIHLQLNEESLLKQALAGEGGGILGGVCAWFLLKCFARTGSYIVLTTATVIVLLLLTDRSILGVLSEIGRRLKGALREFWEWLVDLFNLLFAKGEQEGASTPPPKLVVDKPQQKVINIPLPQEEPEQDKAKPVTAPASKQPQAAGKVVPLKAAASQTTATEVGEAALQCGNKEVDNYRLPPLELLQKNSGVRNARNEREIAEMAQVLEETLLSFGVNAHVIQASQGPAITRFEVQPAQGVKVSKIVNLADDLALSMAVPDIRIEAPIPGKAAVGIEVPNKKVQAVYLREILERVEISSAGSKLNVVLGKDIAGNPVLTDIAKAPHLLIAGATGSGKSVCINALIASILYQAKPHEVKFLLVDPKMVELTNYNGIPHLIAPVVTDAKKAAAALKWIVTEMENRYRLFASKGVRDIKRYNELQAGSKEEQARALPAIVVIIDELADLMMVAPGDVEDAICRLTQMARAAGIHLVVATQRPSVDVITGIIKANIPSRIAFAVSSQVDSRTIIDMNGAEKLLGRGDMLFLPVGASKPIRIQGVYISDQEVEALVSYVKEQGKPEYLEGDFMVAQEQASAAAAADDPLLAEAIQFVVERGQASASLLQRKYKLGYNRAARLIDIMEERGIVGPHEGSKPREVLITPEDLKE